MNDWMQVKVLTTTAGADLVSEILLEAGSEGTMIEDRNDVFENQRPEGQWDIIDEAIAERIGDDVKVTGYYPADANLRDVLARIQSELERLRGMELGMKLGKLEIRTEGFENEDWAESWKKSYKPFRLGEHIVIRPGWTQYDPQPGDRVIEIDPGLAFGTGSHATTQLCRQALEKTVRPGDRVLDLGCGSGILSIAALKLGAESAQAVDIDEKCLNVAYENAALNGIGRDRYTVRVGDVLSDEALRAELGGGYDIVVANIVADVILGLAPMVRQFLKPGGQFLCSGIIDDRAVEVADGLRRCGWAILETREESGWFAYSCR